jgi:hypothetical protein
MMQITNRQTYQLRKGLHRWPIVELGIFLSQVMNTSTLGYEKWYFVAYCSSVQTTHGKPSNDDVSNEIRMAASEDSNDLIPVIDFIALAADHDDSACQAAFDGGFLDMLLRIYILFPKPGRETSALVKACTSALLVMSRQPEHLEAIIHHPFCALWTTYSQLFQMSAMLDDSTSSRCAAWRRTEKPSVISRLVMIYKNLLSTSNLHKTAATDMCIDLVELSRSVFCVVCWTSTE